MAPALLGRELAATSPDGTVVVRLTEVEAYGGLHDPASHAARGRTPRTTVMFGPPGHLYVYFVYGMHWCCNVVCGPDGTAGAVLLRAGAVVAGRELARARRPSARSDAELARGPARLAAALGLGRLHAGVDLCRASSPARLLAGTPAAAGTVVTGPRVGVTAAADALWRFWVAGDPTVSAYRSGTPRRPPVPATVPPRRTGRR